MSVRSLDALIVGGGPAALLTAALLGKRGLRGLVVDQHELESVSPAELSDWSLDDRHAPLLARVHETLGLQDATRRRAVPLRPGLRLLAAGARGELEPEEDPADTLSRVLGAPRDALRKELRALEAEAVRVSAFLERLPAFPASGFFEKRRLASALAEHPEITAPAEDRVSPRLARFLGHLLPFFTHVDAGPLGASEAGHPVRFGRLGRPAELVLHGPRLPDGGRALREVLEERALRSGFEVHRGGLDGLEPEGRRFRVTAANRREVILVSALVDATQDLSGLEALPHRVRGRKLAGTLEAARPAGWLVRTSWSVDRSALPGPLGHAALVLPESAEERPMWLTVSEGAQDRLRLAADVPVRAAEHRAGLPAISEATRARIARLFPFFSERSAPDGPARARPLFAPDLDPATRLGGVPVRTPVKNVFVAGPVVLPGCVRVEGAYLAAWQAAEAVAAALS